MHLKETALLAEQLVEEGMMCYTAHYFDLIKITMVLHAYC